MCCDEIMIVTCMLLNNLAVSQKEDKKEYRAEVARSRHRRHGNTAKGRSARVVSNFD